ncbi:MAG: uroporphyrinogen decarboxylase family protein [Treponema sp.]|jgi:uroporphyrinogen decarboxylase|nr:uroporphyrinogen decarboxylase family protein [Treponema sp.]
MNSKEIFKNVLDLRFTERLPVAVESGGAWALNTSGLTLQKAIEAEPEAIADILYRAYTDAGSDLVWSMAGYNNLIVGALGGKITFRAKGTPEILEPLLKKPSDVDTLNTDAILDDPMIKKMLEVTAALAKKTAEKHYLALTRWGPFTLAGLLYGVENCMRDIRKDPEGVRHILDWAGDLFLAYVDGYIRAGVEIVQLAEPTASGDMISLKHFKEFALPAFQKVCTALHKKKVKIAIHICGNINNRLDLIADMGADYASIDYKVDLKNARAAFDGKIAFMGNMDPVSIMQQGSVDEVRAACRDCIDRAGGGAGFILAPGCDLPPTTPLENVRAMTELARGYRF